MSPPTGVDLDVTFINRTSLYHSYCVQFPADIPGQPGIPYLCPGTDDDQRWPEPGEIVAFTAHVVNKGTVGSPAFDYAWSIDGAEVASGTLPGLAAAQEVTATYHWPWGHELSHDGQKALGEHTVRFTADPEDVIPETYETNNSLADSTSAMSFIIHITPEMVDAYNVPVDPRWPWSAEDWLQKQIAVMNANFANSAYPIAPQGATVRVRIDDIVITAVYPGPDGQHDGGWVVDGDYRHGVSTGYDAATDIDWALIHELSHQVSIIDLYTISATPDSVFVTDRHGHPANMGFFWTHDDLMGGGDIAPYTDHRLYSSHTAAGASTYRGYRNGYYGSYLYDIPLHNYLRVLDSRGDPAPGVQVALYQRASRWDWMGQQSIDATPEITGTTDAHGIVALTNRSAHGGTVTANGHVLRDNPFGVVDIQGPQDLFLVKLSRGDHDEFRWLEITQFNLAYWMGDTISHTFTITSHVPPPGAPDAPEVTSMHVEGSQATLCWQPSASPGVVGYRVYRAAPVAWPYIPASDLLSTTCFRDTIPGPWPLGGHVYAVVAVDGSGRESGFSALTWASDLVNPSAAVIAPGGDRIILDPQEGYALLRQDADGMYLENVGASHDYFPRARFIALDANQHLIVNHPGDWVRDRPSVWVLDLEGTPLLEFGERGSGPGQFEGPSGVAGWGGPCSVGGPYEVDEHTLLLLHLDGSYTGAQGQPGTPAGTEFAAGRYGQGVFLDEGDTLIYRTAGNLNLAEGALEFWLRPDWAGDDQRDYAFFEVGNDWFNRIRIAKDGANILRIALWDSSAEYGAGHWVGDWKAGEWHHIGVTWQKGTVALYEDGVQVDRRPARFPDWLTEPMYVGSGSWDGRVANGVIDEFRISNVPRLSNSDSCGRTLVADSGNHRVQAFDSLGHVVDVFGSFGSDPGQFDNPQGLVVDRAGRVIVVDQGNNRLVVLGFDGQTFDYLTSYEAGFRAPVGVAADIAADGRGNLAVADTNNNRVVVLDAQGEFQAEFTAPNDGYTGAFRAPRGVVIEADGDLVVADTGNSRVVTVRGALPRTSRLWLPLIFRR